MHLHLYERVGGLVPFSEDLPPLDEDDLDDEMDSEALPPADEPTEVAEAQMSRPIVVVRSDDEAPPERAGTPIPTTWRRTGGKFASRHLFGVGLNLFDIRPPPFEGRLAERDLLWKALREIYDTGLGRAIILRGSEGMGRTRLGTWFCQRADEVGAARVLTARHDTSGADESGASHFGAVALIQATRDRAATPISTVACGSMRFRSTALWRW